MTAIQTDLWGILLAFVFLTVVVGAVGLASWLAGLGVEPAMSGSSGGEQAAAGAGWALAEVAVALVFIAAILVWKRLPEWVQDTVKSGIVFVVAMHLGRIVGDSGFWPVAALLVGYYAIHQATDAYDIYWLWNNVEAFVIAIIFGGMIGSVLPIPFLVAGLIGLTIYDHVFANEKDWMFTLGEGMLRAKLPVIVFAFPRLRVNWDDICDAVGGNEDEIDDETVEMMKGDSGFGIGMADLLLPAAFAAAVTVSGGGVTLPVLGVVVGVVVAAFRLRWEMINIGGGAGLPAITGSVLGGWGVASVVVLAL